MNYHCAHCGNPDCSGLCPRAQARFEALRDAHRKPEPTMAQRAEAWLKAHPLFEAGAALTCVALMIGLVFQGCQLLLGGAS